MRICITFLTKIILSHHLKQIYYHYILITLQLAQRSWTDLKYRILNGQCHEIFCFWFFSWISFPPAPSIPFRPFRIFSKIRPDIRKSRCTTGINDTGGKFATGVNDAGDKVAADINDTGGKFATGVVDTGGKTWAANVSANFRKNSKRP